MNPTDIGAQEPPKGSQHAVRDAAKIKIAAGSRPVGAKELVPTLFHELWWLEVASGGTIEHVSVMRDGICVVNLYFMRRNTFGVRQLRMPPYTRMLGPTFALPPSKSSTRLVNIRRLTGEVIDQLPPHDRLFLTLPPASESAFAFSVAGYTLEPNYTFRVARDVPVARLWDEIDQKTRNVIRTARRRWTVSRHYDLSRFQRLSLANHPGNLNDFDLLGRIFSACVARGRALILAAEDENGRDAASAILVWGADTVYYLLSARNPVLASGGTNSLLIWTAIEFAKERNFIFDFDGYGGRGGALFLEKFGMIPMTRPTIQYANTKGRLLETARGVLEGVIRAGSGTGPWPARVAAKAASTVFDLGRIDMV